MVVEPDAEIVGVAGEVGSDKLDDRTEDTQPLPFSKVMF
jgi:hypothetical protein